MDQVVVENNYLSDKQKTQREEEFAACKDSTACRLQVGSKWDLIDAGQQASYGAGMLVGVPAGLVDSVQSIVNRGLSPVETYDAMKSLFNSGEVLGNVSDAVKQWYITRLENMEAEYQKAGASGSFNAGVEGGKLISEIASLAAGGAGVAKGGAILTEKIAAKVVGKAEQAATKVPPNAWKAGEGEYSVKPGGGVTDVEYPGGKYDGDSLPYKAELSAQAGADIVKTGTVFDSIKATQPAIPGTSIPKSLELNVNGQTVWVNPNATKHMGEYLTRNGLSHSTTEGSQAMLTSLQSAVKDASSTGLKFNEKMQVGRVGANI